MFGLEKVEINISKMPMSQLQWGFNIRKKYNENRHSDAA